MNTQTAEIYELFSIVSPESQDLLLLKKAPFEQFLRFLPEGTLQAFREHQKLIPPKDRMSVSASEWIDHAIKRLGLKQKSVCGDLTIDASRFSRFLNHKGSLEPEEIDRIFEHLRIKLVAAGLLKP